MYTLLLLASLAAICSHPVQNRRPEIPREFRAVWIATVDHVDWPPRGEFSSDNQKASLIKLLDRAASLKLNTVIFQVRPAADALYFSNLEPWSEYLTGRQGQAPNPIYDPLEFAVEEAHKRGLQIHAWFNPYRAELLSAKGPLSAHHIANTHPQLVKRYGSLLWMDPGEPAIRERSLAVIEDVVRRYNIDGVHLDDYFYPYPEDKKPFPDDDSYARYGKGLTKLQWRHKNVDDFIAKLHDGIHRIKPWVEFGISPFGIYRPNIPAGIKAGVDQYVDLSSDPVKWLQKGWCDYLSPQLYWPIDQKAQSFPILLNWWRSQNTLERHLWPGIYTSRVLSSRKGFSSQEVVNQVLLTEQDTPDPGQIHFSMKALSEDAKGIDEALAHNCYQNLALSPASPWLGSRKPKALDLNWDVTNHLSWPSRPGAFRNILLFAQTGASWQFRILSSDAIGFDLSSLPTGRPNRVEVAGVSRTGAIGDFAVKSPN
jgi:uncharacterized lipoprotein YddW (UPF0748 family)